jgi:membrane protein involved in colicin uptake
MLAAASSLAAQAAPTTMPICKDGTTSTVAGRGACSGHQGVDKKATDAAKKAAAKASKTAAATTKTADKAAEKSADAAKATAKTADKTADKAAAKTSAAAKTGTAAVNVPNAVAAPGGGNGKVWVNTKSGVFHREGDQWYGKTKAGKYMTEDEAVKAGYRAEKGTPRKKP